MDKLSLKPFLIGGHPTVKAFSQKGESGITLSDNWLSETLFELLLLAFTLAFLLSLLQPAWLILPTTMTGGDTGSHFFTARYLVEHLLPRGRMSGWCMGNYAGFPMLEYYFPGPFVLMAAIAPLFGLQVAFKLVFAMSALLVPMAAWAFFRFLGRPFPVAVAAAALATCFLVNEGQTMWGGNLASDLAGEFAYGWGFALAVAWLGLVHRAMETGRHTVLSAAGLALVGFFHAYALLFAGFSTMYFLLVPGRFRQNAARLLKIHGLAFLFLCFWLLPLLAHLPNTTRFNIQWIFHDRAQVFREVFPVVLWPGMAMFLAAVAWSLVARIRGRESSLSALAYQPVEKLGIYSLFKNDEMQGARISRNKAYLWYAARTRNEAQRRRSRFSTGCYTGFLCAMGILLYLAGYRARVVDVRFLPFFQFFAVAGGALLLEYLAGPRRTSMGRAAAAMLAIAAVLGGLAWADSRITFVDKWVRGNMVGFENKALWPEYRALCDRIAGGPADPRVAYEHSGIHWHAGTIRAFENLPLFSGRSTLEGVYIQASPTAPFIFHTQSEMSRVASTPIPDYFYSRFRPDRGARHLAMFNAELFIAAEPETKQALAASPHFNHRFSSGPYDVFRLPGVSGRYVEPLSRRPVRLPEENWRQTAYRWFRLGDMDTIPVFCDDSDSGADPRFASMPAGGGFALPLPVEPLPRIDTGAMREEISQEEIRVTGATPGRPLLVKVSHHPNWRVEGADRIYLAGPGFMLIFPDRPDVRLVYGPGAAKCVGWALTLAAVLLALAFGLPAVAGRLAGLAAWFDRRAWILVIVLLAVFAAGLGWFLGPASPEFPTTPFNEAIAMFREKDYAAGKQRFAYVLERHPQSLIAGEAAYHLAMCDYRMEQWDQAVEALDRLMEEYPESSRHAEALYHKGLCLDRAGVPEKAVRAWQRTVREFPGSVWADFSRDRLAEKDRAVPDGG